MIKTYFIKSIRQKVFGQKYSAKSIRKNLVLYEYFVNNFSAFENVATGSPINIPQEIDAKFVKYAEEIISKSYTQSEKFSSVSI